jgi:hypothetical protein
MSGAAALDPRALPAHAAAAELLRYDQNPLPPPDPGATGPWPLEDEPFVEAWSRYVREAETHGVAATLRRYLPQLRFPVAPGVSGTPAYRASTLAGASPPPGPGLALRAPERLHLFLHPTAAGRVPVIVAEDRDDFTALVRALARRNEPSPVPPAMGATMVAGYNNWERIHRLRTRHTAGTLDAGGAGTWAEAFARIRSQKELYQDRFILLSTGPYSGVAGADLGLEEEAWLRASRTVRLEHECTHYFTRRVLGHMRSHLLDEVVADFVGISCAAGEYRAGWFLRFMGLEHPERYRPGGRLEHYRGTPPLSDDAFVLLQALVRSAAARLETAARNHPGICTTAQGRARCILTLASLTLSEMAADGAEVRIATRLAGDE